MRSGTSSGAALGAIQGGAPIVAGSHIDTQPTGGKFDGNYGVLAGLEVVRTLNDHSAADRRSHRGRSVDQRGRDPLTRPS